VKINNDDIQGAAVALRKSSLSYIAHSLISFSLLLTCVLKYMGVRRNPHLFNRGSHAPVRKRIDIERQERLSDEL
jgi:hypothetical protein